MQVIAWFKELHSEMTAWRHELHAHPQRAFEETFASEFSASKLQAWSIETHRGLAKTGVVGIVRGQKDAASSTLQTIGLRADIDALGIQEQNDVPYRSRFADKPQCYWERRTNQITAKKSATNRDDSCFGGIS